MKRFLAILLSVLMLVSLCACAAGGSSGDLIKVGIINNDPNACRS